MMPSCDTSDSTLSANPTTSEASSEGLSKNPLNSIRVRHGKGTHAIINVRKMMSDKENWVQINTAKEYQYLGPEVVSPLLSFSRNRRWNQV